MYDWQNTLKCFNTHVTTIGEFAFFLSLDAPRMSATGNLNLKTPLKIRPSSCIKFSFSVQRLTRRPLITIFLEMNDNFVIFKKSKNAHPLTSWRSLSNRDSVMDWIPAEVWSWLAETVRTRSSCLALRTLTILDSSGRDDILAGRESVCWYGSNSEMGRYEKNIYSWGRVLIGWTKIHQTNDWRHWGSSHEEGRQKTTAKNEGRKKKLFMFLVFTFNKVVVSNSGSRRLTQNIVE